MEKAKDCFLSVLQLSPNHLNSLRYLVELYGRENAMKDALTYQQKIVDLRKADNAPDLLKEYRKLMKLFDSVFLLSFIDA